MRQIVRVMAAIAVAATVANSSLAASSAVDVSIGPVTGITIDAAGAVYLSSASIVYRLDPGGTLARVAGNGLAGYSGDGGPAADAQLDIPFDNYPELRGDPTQYGPLVGGLTVDATGNLFIADVYNNRIRRVDSAGIISTVAGGGPAGFRYPYLLGDVLLAGPQGVAFDKNGDLYIAAVFGTLSRISREGTITSVLSGNCTSGLQGPGLCNPGQIAIDATGNVYVPDGLCRVRKVSAGNAVTVAGNGFSCGYSGDGVTAISAALSNQPFAVALDDLGNLYIADTYNYCIRKVDTAGIITTFAGICGQAGFRGDGGAATAALLKTPFGVAVDANGNVYIADTQNFRVRRVGTDGRISTVAGNGNSVPEVIAAIASPTAAVAIGPGFTGAWFDPEQSGHGIFIEVLSDSRFLAWWFTFNPSGTQQAWFGGVGTYVGNVATIAGVDQITGGRWIPDFDPAQIVHNPWGTLTFTFNDCSHGKVDFNSVNGYGTGSMKLTRLTQPAGLSCP